jgi:Uma2 family endonuclease
MSDLIKTHTTTEAYFAMPETMQPTQLIHGEIIEMPPPELHHQDLVLALGILFSACAKALGGKAYVAPVYVVLGDDIVLQPDALYTSPNSSAQPDSGKRLRGAPELVAEVLSPSTAYLDRGKKFTLYEKHGVAEYWLVDPQSHIIEVYQRNGDAFARLGVYSSDEQFTSRCIGQVNTNAIFEG